MTRFSLHSSIGLNRLFLPWIIVELIAIYLFIKEFGFLNLVLEIIASAVLGLFLMSRVGFFQVFSRSSFLRVSDIFSGLGIAFGGFLLFLPGLVSDFFGIAIAIVSVIAGLKGRSAVAEEEREFYERQNSQRGDENGEIIDVEIIEESRKIN